MSLVQAPFDLEVVRRCLASQPDDPRRRPIGLRQVVIGMDALDALQDAVAPVRGHRDLVVLTDATSMRRGEADLKTSVRRRLAGLGPVRVVVLGSDRPDLHADERALHEADEAIQGASCVVSVGAGTVTDIAKDATFRAGIPFVAVQTAVSVNGFSDDMAVLLRRGVKRTVPSHWPSALIVDLEAIASAPPAMNRAGFGELMGMFTAPADWYLANVVGADDAYDAEAVQLYRAGGDRLLAQATGVAEARHDALAELAVQMTLTGIAMGVAGRSAPLSGAEHTISHLLDMAAARDGRALAFHGAQVGVAAVLVAIAWARVLRDFDPARLVDDDAYPSIEPLRARVHAAFDRLDPNGAATAECWSDYQRKARRWNGSRPRLAEVAAGWDRHREEIAALVLEPSRIVTALRAAGAPTRFSELDPPVPAEVARWAVASCHLMRDRFTVADLIDRTRGLDEACADDLLAEATEIGAGL